MCGRRVIIIRFQTKRAILFLHLFQSPPIDMYTIYFVAVLGFTIVDEMYRNLDKQTSAIRKMELLSFVYLLEL